MQAQIDQESKPRPKTSYQLCKLYKDYSYVRTFNVDREVKKSICVYTYIYIYMHTFMYMLCICIRTYIYMYMYMFIHMYVYMYMHMHTYMYVYMYTYHVYLCIHTSKKLLIRAWKACVLCGVLALLLAAALLQIPSLVQPLKAKGPLSRGLSRGLHIATHILCSHLPKIRATHAFGFMYKELTVRYHDGNAYYMIGFPEAWFQFLNSIPGVGTYLLPARGRTDSFSTTVGDQDSGRVRTP